MTAFSPAWDGYLADPFVLRTADGYYVFGTDGPEQVAYNKTGRQFPILRSPDLKRWEWIGGALTVPKELQGLHFWAPEVAAWNGRYYMYYSAGGEQGEGQRLRVAVARRPEGPYEDLGRWLMPREVFSIDPSPFRDPVSGKWFLFYARDYFNSPVGTGIAVVPLAGDLSHVRGRYRTLIRARADWQIYERDRQWYGKTWRRWHTCEGPFAIHRHGRYYLFYSGGNWQQEGYGLSCAVAETVLGPYSEPAGDGALVLRSQPGLRGPGHSCVVVWPDGSDAIVFHAWDETLTKRQMHVAPLTWRDKDGIPFPVVNV
ncbi:MAG: hypothetical protein QOJ65_2667 [Fimbriimonadaceae bacterium]|jgi:beta-xylosidase|nr:hypothetical protein [Fimbriimonadaceae bacterium]